VDDGQFPNDAIGHKKGPRLIGSGSLEHGNYCNYGGKFYPVRTFAARVSLESSDGTHLRTVHGELGARWWTRAGWWRVLFT
jgi:hypothetical protein